MEERRRVTDGNWEEIKNFIAESRQYRAADEVTQKYQAENLEMLKIAVQKQNGRTFELEKWREEVKNKSKNNIAIKENLQSFIMVVCTIIMAVSAIVMFFKPH